MAVKGKKQQQKPSPKLVKHQEEEEEKDEEEDSDAGEDEELEEQSDEEVAEQEKDDAAEQEEDDDDDDEEEEAKDAKKKVEKKDTASGDDDMKTTIFVGHINYQLSKKELDDFFCKAGEIQSSRIISKRGYAFITFADAASVEEALKLDKEMLAGKAVHVERVKSKKTDNFEKKQQKRKRNKEDNEKGAKKAKLGDKTVQMKKSFNKGGKGRPKTAQHTNPNKKKNKPKSGQFVKAQE